MDKNYIIGIMQKILNKEFSDPIRRKIVTYDDRINFCAPCCGDSHKNKYAKRGNLYFNKLFYICFNCDKKTTFDRKYFSFFKIKIEMNSFINDSRQSNY